VSAADWIPVGDRLPPNGENVEVRARSVRQGGKHSTLWCLPATCVTHWRPLVAVGTPSSRWAANGEPDPHGDRYACERAALAMGDLTDDELANAVFLLGDSEPSIADLASGKAILPIAYLTAAKDRIRWLSRRLAEATTPAGGAYDRELIARMLESIACGTVYGRDSVIEQIRLLREADNAEASRIGTVCAPAGGGGEIRWPERMVNLPDPAGSTDRIVGFRVPENDPILGEFGLSEPLAWLRSVTVDRRLASGGSARLNRLRRMGRACLSLTRAQL